MQLAHALASAAPACSRDGTSLVRSTLTRALMPLTRLSSNLLTGLFTHILLRAPAACSCAEGLLVRSRRTSPSIAGVYHCLSESSDAHAFQIAPAASSLPSTVPVLSCRVSSWLPFRRLKSLTAMGLSTMAFHKAVVALSWALQSPSRSILTTCAIPLASWKAIRFSAHSVIAFATAAAAAILTREEPLSISCTNFSTPPNRFSSSCASTMTHFVFVT
mmetsp:Transcript_96286/g.140778  ORF Transcript_96286/g.140778 Transcript_96286/m.140778 type:complete len:218 (+) Transcript_96286:452-1105(+)